MSDKAQMNEHMQTLFVDIDFKNWKGEIIAVAKLKIPPDQFPEDSFCFDSYSITAYASVLQTQLIKDFEKENI